MNDKIKAYVDSLFKGLKPSDSLNETKEELVINLNEKYQDLLSEGLSPEQAYKKVIASIGDVEELIQAESNGPKVEQKVEVNIIHPKKNPNFLRAVAVFFFILCPVPILVLGSLNQDLEIFGVVALLAMVAIGVMLMMLSRGSSSEPEIKHTSHQNHDKRNDDFKSDRFSVFTRKDKRLLSNINGLIYIIAAILFFSKTFGLFGFGFSIFILAYAVTKIVELMYYYARINALEKANNNLPKEVIYHDVYKMSTTVVWTIAVVIFFSGIMSFKYSWIVFLIAAGIVQLVKTILDMEDDEDEEN